MVYTDLWPPLGQRSGNALLIREAQLCCPTMVAPSAPRGCTTLGCRTRVLAFMDMDAMNRETELEDGSGGETDQRCSVRGAGSRASYSNNNKPWEEDGLAVPHL
jgi:hypothetical protein